MLIALALEVVLVEFAVSAPLTVKLVFEVVFEVVAAVPLPMGYTP
jgi:hypothetical protein